MPLLGRHKSPSSSSQSVAAQQASGVGGGNQQAAAGRQQVCESPLFGIRRQLGRDNKDSGGGIVSESQAKRELGSVPQQITREQIHYAFSIMDTNKDGLIDLRDLSQMLSNLGVPIDEAILSHIMSSVSKRGKLILKALSVHQLAVAICFDKNIRTRGSVKFKHKAICDR